MNDPTRPISTRAIDLSVVLIVRHPKETPDAVLKALARCTTSTKQQAQYEIILVDGRPDADELNVAFSNSIIRLVRPEMNMPRLKAEGLAVARGTSVAFLEPKAVPDESWLNVALTTLAEHPEAALGGAVIAGNSQAIDKAAYAFEYDAFSHTSLARHSGTDLPGNNMILPLAALNNLCGDILEVEGLNKPFCQSRLVEGEVSILSVASMVVRTQTQYRLFALLGSRFHYARCFGGTRAALANSRKRWLYRLGAPVVPVMLLYRHLGAALRKDQPDRLNAGGLAALCALCLVWSAGEAAGSWFGPGNTCDRLY